MIRLDLKAGPHWVDLIDGVRVKVRPLTTSLLMAAHAGKDATDDVVESVARVAEVAIVEWEGIGQQDSDDPPGITPETVRALLEIPAVFAAFQAKVMRPWEGLAEEKKD